MPIAKATGVVPLATAGQADLAGKIAQGATVNSSFETWF